ncbi:hypothetical protein P9858_23810 [Niallia circulans]|uniref:hypothetical protein n=1 Tax=Niallia circulans TaxID=1397 RepID=UPI002E216201|nr:hypothetical protein [Niallia circulans]
MKELALENVGIESVGDVEKDRLEIVLAESERILNRVNERLDRIDDRHKQMELKLKQIDGFIYFTEWKETKEGVK